MTILAAIGEEERSNPIVPVGYDLATTYGDELVALHVTPEEEFQEYRARVEDRPGFDTTFSRAQENAARVAEQVVGETLEDFDRGAVSTMGRVGDPVEEILDVADQVDARYLVVGGRRRSPVGKAVFGNTTQDVLLGAEMPVVTVMID